MTTKVVSSGFRFLCDGGEQTLASRICKVMICGNSIHYDDAAIKQLDNKKLKVGQSSLAANCRALDSMICQLASSGMKLL
jgi:hypothetical protein